MANFGPLDPGQINGAGDDRALFLKQFAGEVLAQFEIMNVMKPLTFVKQGTGKSIQWPRIGRATSAYHTKGEQLTGQEIASSEIVAVVDKILDANVFIDKLDESMSHFDLRAKYVRELALKLSNDLDEHTMIEGLKGARLTAVGSELPTGTPFNGSLTFNTSDGFMQAAEATGGTAASVEAKIDNITNALFDAAARLDDNEVPDEGRYVVFAPREYRQLAKAVQTNGFSLHNTDYGTSGSVAGGKIFSVAGFMVIRSTKLPRTNLGTTGLYQFHGGDYSDTVALIGVKDAVGIGEWLPLSVDVDPNPRAKGTLYIADYAVAIKYLRPEALIELKVTTGPIL